MRYFKKLVLAGLVIHSLGYASYFSVTQNLNLHFPQTMKVGQPGLAQYSVTNVSGKMQAIHLNDLPSGFAIEPKSGYCMDGMTLANGANCSLLLSYVSSTPTTILDYLPKICPSAATDIGCMAPQYKMSFTEVETLPSTSPSLSINNPTVIFVPTQTTHIDVTNNGDATVNDAKLTLPADVLAKVNIAQSKLSCDYILPNGTCQFKVAIKDGLAERADESFKVQGSNTNALTLTSHVELSDYITINTATDIKFPTAAYTNRQVIGDFVVQNINDKGRTVYVNSASLPAGATRIAAEGIAGSDCGTDASFSLAAGASCTIRIAYTSASAAQIAASFPQVCSSSTYSSGCVTPSPTDMNVSASPSPTATLTIGGVNNTTTIDFVPNQTTTVVISNTGTVSANNVKLTLPDNLKTYVSSRAVTECASIAAGGTCTLSLPIGAVPTTLPSENFSAQGGNTNTVALRSDVRADTLFTIAKDTNVEMPSTIYNNVPALGDYTVTNISGKSRTFYTRSLPASFTRVAATNITGNDCGPSDSFTLANNASCTLRLSYVSRVDSAVNIAMPTICDNATGTNDCYAPEALTTLTSSAAPTGTTALISTTSNNVDFAADEITKITVTNMGSTPANNVHLNLDTLPTALKDHLGSGAITTCSATLAPLASCTLTLPMDNGLIPAVDTGAQSPSKVVIHLLSILIVML